jgi:hypothetical protein
MNADQPKPETHPKIPLRSAETASRNRTSLAGDQDFRMVSNIHTADHEMSTFSRQTPRFTVPKTAGKTQRNPEKQAEKPEIHHKCPEFTTNAKVESLSLTKCADLGNTRFSTAHLGLV